MTTDNKGAMTDEQIRTEWRKAGGGIHGPFVETVTMLEAEYFNFRRSLAAQPAQAVTEITDDEEMRHATREMIAANPEGARQEMVAMAAEIRELRVIAPVPAEGAVAAPSAGLEQAFSSTLTKRRDDLDLEVPTIYLDRFIAAMGFVCQKQPPKELCEKWLSNESEDLQSWAVSNARIYWMTGIGAIEAAQHLADEPEEGRGHEGFTKDFAAPEPIHASAQASNPMFCGMTPEKAAHLEKRESPKESMERLTREFAQHPEIIHASDIDHPDTRSGSITTTREHHPLKPPGGICAGLSAAPEPIHAIDAEKIHGAPDLTK